MEFVCERIAHIKLRNKSEIMIWFYVEALLYTFVYSATFVMAP